MKRTVKPGLAAVAFKVDATAQINRILKLIRSEWPEAHPSCQRNYTGWPRFSFHPPPPTVVLVQSPYRRSPPPVIPPFLMMESLRSFWGYDCQTLRPLPLVRYWITPFRLLKLTNKIVTYGDRGKPGWKRPTMILGNFVQGLFIFRRSHWLFDTR